jgi:selenocysteine lyase/cysteine desulfurase
MIDTRTPQEKADDFVLKIRRLEARFAGMSDREIAFALGHRSAINRTGKTLMRTTTTYQSA